MKALVKKRRTGEGIKWMIAERILGGMIGNMLVQLSILSFNQLTEALRTQRDLTLESIHQQLTPEQQAIFERICKDKDGSCPVDVVVQAANAQLEQQGLPVIEGKVQSPTLGQVLRYMGVVADDGVIELASAVQAVDRTTVMATVFGEHGLNREELDKARATFNDSAVVSLERIDPQPWIDSAPPLTRQAQATHSMVKLFVNILEHAEDRGQRQLYEQEPVQEAVRAIKALAYLEKKEVADAFLAAGFRDTADKLHQEVHATRLSQVGEEKSGLLAKLARGVVHGLDFIGLKRDGSERGFLGHMLRGVTNGIARLGYTLDEESSVMRLLSGIQTGIDHLTGGPMKSNSIDPRMLYGWLAQKAEQVGLDAMQIETVLTSYGISDKPLITQALVAEVPQQAAARS